LKEIDRVSGAARDTRYARFLGWGLLAVAALSLLGYLPTRRLGGDRGLIAMAVGCGIGWISAALGAWPLLRAGGRSPHERLQGMLLAMGIRALVAVGLAALALAAGDFDRRALLLWLAIAYGLLLALEVRFALRAG
jgi:hypothetical protein